MPRGVKGSRKPEEAKEVVPPLVFGEEHMPLYRAYKAACDDITLFENAVENARTRKGDAVAKIVEQFGKRKYQVNGQILEPVQRGDTWFFRSIKIAD